MRLSSFFKTSSCWIKNDLAIDTNGETIDMMAYNPILMKDRKIKAMSLHGAIGYFFNYENDFERRNRTINTYKKAIEIYTGKNYYIAEFNNRPETSFEDIVKVIKIAEKI